MPDGRPKRIGQGGPATPHPTYRLDFRQSVCEQLVKSIRNFTYNREGRRHLRGPGHVLNDDALDELQYQVDQQNYHQHRYDQAQRVPRHPTSPLFVTNPYTAA